MRDLKRYRARRDPATTPEPFGAEPDGAPRETEEPRRFVVQQHAARRMHWDLRLEIDGVLASWAVPKGPSLDPRERRLAVRTEDHPLEYADFEGVIPPGNYGAGAMIVWDAGTWRSADATAPADALAAGKLDLWLAGHKLYGRFALVRTRGQGDGRDWLLIRKGDPPAEPGEVVEILPGSVWSGLTVEEVAAGVRRDAELAEALRGVRAPRRALARDDLRPMLAARGDGAFSSPGWLFELKYDGVRAVSEKRGDEVRVLARSGADRTRVYPEVAVALSRLPVESCVLDGEIVALDETGRSSFERLQRRFTQSDPARVARERVAVPVVYYVFDLLSVLGRDLRALPLLRRKQLLARLAPRAGVIRFVDHVEGDGERLFEAAAEHHLEGVVAKRADSPYLSDRRSPRWRKCKVPRTADLVVCGLTRGRGSRAPLGSVALGGWRDGRLRYVGNAGSGLRECDVDELLRFAERAGREEPPCEGAEAAGETRWLRAERVCRVRYTEVTSAGLLRHPVFEGLLPGADPRACEAPRARTGGPARATAGPPAPAPAALPEAAVPFQVTRPDKVFWPDQGYTKGDLVAYYQAVWPWIAPYLEDRPVVLTRYPDGIEGKSFFQKNAPDFTPEWARHENIEGTDYFLCDDLQTLLYVINSGAIPLHIWSARRASLERPDWMILDLDPKEAPFSDVVRVARHVHGLLGGLGAAHFVKTSGKSGLHVLVPLGGRLDHDQSRALAEVLARVVVAELPELATITRPVARRGDKVYVDFLQNGRGKLIAAPLCVREVPGAPVSMPLRFSQLTRRLNPARFDIRRVPGMLRRRGDPCRGVLGEGVDVEALLAALAERLEAGED
jgi:bifunctional non-homologous end joining protein LigD